MLVSPQPRPEQPDPQSARLGVTWQVHPLGLRGRCTLSQAFNLLVPVSFASCLIRQGGSQSPRPSLVPV